jgi:hypothetical protein
MLRLFVFDAEETTLLHRKTPLASTYSKYGALKREDGAACHHCDPGILEQTTFHALSALEPNAAMHP